MANVNYNFGENFVIKEDDNKEDNEKNEMSMSNNKYEQMEEVQNSKTPTNKSIKLTQSETNLEKFKSLEKNSANNSKYSRKFTNSKNNSISLKSKASGKVSENRYQEEMDNAEDDILDQIQRSENSKKNEKSLAESLKNMEENNERFVVQDRNEEDIE